MGAIHKMAATLGYSPTARATRGNFSSQRGLPHLAKHFFLGFLFLLRAKQNHTNQHLSARHPFLITLLIFAFTGQIDRRKVWGNLWRSSVHWRRYFGKTELISMHGVTLLRSQGSQCFFNLQEDFLFVRFDSRMMKSWTSAAVSNVSGSFRCTLHMHCSQIWETRGGRARVTKVKHKTRTAKTPGVETFFCGENKGRTKCKRMRRLPPTTALRVTVQDTLHAAAVLCVLLSPTLLTIIDPKKIEISCSNSFCGLIFQVLQTQRPSVSITLSVLKQKEQKVALPKWVFLGRTQPAIHPACTHVQKCPADPDRRHFVNSPHFRVLGFDDFQWGPSALRPRYGLFPSFIESHLA